MVKSIRVYLHNNIFKPIKGYLKQGFTPEKMAFTLAVSLVVGTVPIWGVVTILCFLSASVFKLNLPVMIAITTAITPLQIFGYVPFIELGVGIFGREAVNFSFSEMAYMMQTDFMEALKQMGYANLMGVVAWLVIAIPGGWLVYHASIPLFKKLSTVSFNGKFGLE